MPMPSGPMEHPQLHTSRIDLHLGRVKDRLLDMVAESDKRVGEAAEAMAKRLSEAAERSKGGS